MTAKNVNKIEATDRILARILMIGMRMAREDVCHVCLSSYIVKAMQVHFGKKIGHLL